VEIHVEETAEAAAECAAGLVVEAADRAVADRGTFFIAVSGGHTPWAMFQRLRSDTTFPWEKTVFYQVDERIVPRSDPDRNLAHLVESLPENAVVRPLPVDDDDLDAACDRYAASLPERFDLIHLGLGDDGHTASLVPGDSVLEIRDRLVALTGGEYMGHRRMTLTYPALSRTRELLWLVAGASKQVALSRLLAGDHGIPAGAVDAPHAVLVTDHAARA
jgi:6-phosphogluconolactonase